MVSDKQKSLKGRFVEWRNYLIKEMKEDIFEKKRTTHETRLRAWFFEVVD
jgi:hypothetical protein